MSNSRALFLTVLILVAPRMSDTAAIGVAALVAVAGALCLIKELRSGARQ